MTTPDSPMPPDRDDATGAHRAGQGAPSDGAARGDTAPDSAATAGVTPDRAASDAAPSENAPPVRPAPDRAAADRGPHPVAPPSGGGPATTSAPVDWSSPAGPGAGPAAPGRPNTPPTTTPTHTPPTQATPAQQPPGQPPPGQPAPPRYGYPPYQPEAGTTATFTRGFDAPPGPAAAPYPGPGTPGPQPGLRPGAVGPADGPAPGEAGPGTTSVSAGALATLIGSLAGIVLVGVGLALALRFGGRIHPGLDGGVDIGALIWTIVGAVLIAIPALVIRWVPWAAIVPGVILAGLSVWAMVTPLDNGARYLADGIRWALDNRAFAAFCANGMGLMVGLSLLLAGIAAVALRSRLIREVRARQQA